MKKADETLLRITVDEYLRGCYRSSTVPHVNELAAILGVDRGTLRRWTLAIYGIPPGRLLKLRRAEHARTLVGRGMPKTHAARRAGFGTTRTFFRNQRNR